MHTNGGYNAIMIQIPDCCASPIFSLEITKMESNN